MRTSFLTTEEIKKIGFKSVGENVLISCRAVFYGAEQMEIGSNVRIDDFCCFTGKIKLGNFIHIAPFTSLCGGKEGIFLEDFVNLSRKIEIFAISDDFTGQGLTNPMIPEKYKKMTHAAVVLKKHVVIGSSSVVLPGVIIEEGCAVGALTLVNKSTLPWGIYAGIPARRVKERRKDLLDYEKEFLEQLNLNKACR